MKNKRIRKNNNNEKLNLSRMTFLVTYKITFEQLKF